MAFAGAQNANASHGMFNDVGQNQYNCIFQLAPLKSAFNTARDISSMVQQVEGSRKQLQVLATSIGTLLGTLDAEYCAGRLSETNTSFALENLIAYVDPESTRNLADQTPIFVVYLMIFTYLCRRKPPPNS
jgi:hypothetical protein